MTSLDHLATIAEIAVALAGFSALVALLAARRGRANPRLEALRLQVMLESSLLVVAFALLPLIVSELGTSAGMAWRISAALFLAVDLPHMAFTMRRFRAYRDSFSSADRTGSVIVQIFGYSGDIAALVIVSGVMTELHPGFYLTAMYLNLLVSAILFVRFAASTFVPDE